MAKDFTKALNAALASDLTKSRAESEKSHDNIVEQLFDSSMKSVLAFVKEKSPHTPKGAEKLLVELSQFMLSSDGVLRAKITTSFPGCIGTHLGGAIDLLQLQNSEMYQKTNSSTTVKLEYKNWYPTDRIFSDMPTYLFVTDHPEYQQIYFKEIFGDIPTYEIPIGSVESAESSDNGDDFPGDDDYDGGGEIDE